MGRALVYGLIPHFWFEGFSSEIMFARNVSICTPPTDIIAKLLETYHEVISTLDRNAIQNIRYAVKTEAEDNNESIDEAIDRIRGFVALLRIVRPVLAYPQYIFSYYVDLDGYSLRFKDQERSCYSITADAGMHKFPFACLSELRDLWQNIPLIVQNHNRVWVAHWLSEGAYFQQYHEFRVLYFAMSLESLFSKDEQRLTHNLVQRASLFLSKDPFIRRKIYGRVKMAYDVRSMIVHGMRAELSRWRLRHAEVVCREVVRRSLVQIIKDTRLINIFDGPVGVYDNFFTGL